MDITTRAERSPLATWGSWGDQLAKCVFNKLSLAMVLCLLGGCQQKFLASKGRRRNRKEKRQCLFPRTRRRSLNTVTTTRNGGKGAMPNLQVVEEQMCICKVEDHFFHHQADAHRRRGVLVERKDRVTCQWGLSLPSFPPPIERQSWSFLTGSHTASAVSPCGVRVMMLDGS